MNDYYQKTIKTYNKIAKKFKERRNVDFWIEEFEIFKNLLKRGKIIDIGCGTGNDSIFFLKNNFDYLGIDASSEMINQAKKFSPKAKFKIMKIEDIDFKNNSFDGFLAINSLLHIPKKEIDNVLQKIKKIIKRNGIGFISMKPKGEKGDIEEGMVKEKRKEFGKNEIERFFALYDIQEFKNILERNDFEVIKSYIKNKENKDWLCYFVKIINNIF